jgi:TATA-box binding protein (TBP) (component of TFIID and TFIIIB)
MKALKPNETNTKGLLIEYDSGYISPELTCPDGVCSNRNILKEFKSGTNLSPDGELPSKIEIYAVLQKWGVENKNGRIYPKEILERESKRYQEFINMGTSLGELNHPECLRGDSEVLTNNGWKKISDIVYDDKIMTLNPETNKIEFGDINKIIKQKFSGQLIHIKGRNIDIQTTPNHKFWVIDRKGVGTFKTVEDLMIDNNSGKLFIPKLGDWCGDESEYFTLNGLNPEQIPNRIDKNKRLEYQYPIKIKTDVWAAFLGIYLSQGCVNSVHKKRKIKTVLTNGETEDLYVFKPQTSRVKITQKKKENIELIKLLLDQMPFNYTITEKPGDSGVDFNIYDFRLWNYLYPLGKSKNKFIPQEVKNFSKENLTILFNWFRIGDGRTIGKKNQSDVFSTSKKLIDDLHEVLVKIGGSGNIRREIRSDKDGFFKSENRIIKKENRNDIWFLNISKTKGVYLDKRFIKFEKIDYNDYVYCLNVPNHIFYVRENGKSFWTGNSSIIDADRVSHRITEIWWDGRTLMGKLELDTTPGYHKMGIISSVGDKVVNMLRKGWTIGISSRGVGSLKSEGGKNVVQSDFELICWDLVTSPSTPGSWISTDHTDLKTYTESVSNEEIKKYINESESNILKGLNKFLK